MDDPGDVGDAVDDELIVARRRTQRLGRRLNDDATPSGFRDFLEPGVQELALRPVPDRQPLAVA